MPATAPATALPVTMTAASPAELVVTQRHSLAEGVISLDLQAANGGPLPARSPGAHIDLLLHGEVTGGDPLTRQYSLCGSPTPCADPPPTAPRGA
jgi:ferredoxin-NADP reductase